MRACVIGAGVAGLSCAVMLHEAGASVLVLEAHARAGGRVRSAYAEDGRLLGDLGPSWVWPPYQPVLSGWLQRLGVQTSPQYEQGDARVERGPGLPPSSLALPGQAGQHRPIGGTQAIVDALLARLPAGTVRTNRPVSAVHRDEAGGRVRVHAVDGDIVEADAVVLALPLRLIAQDIELQPPLPDAVRNRCAATPTWMAAQAKALIVYERAFWRDAGLSGRIASSVGPLVEAHDHCAEPPGPGALIGFIGPDAQARTHIAREHGEHALRALVIEQLVRCFGKAAATPRSLHIEDWALDERIASRRDVQRAGAHPQVLPAAIRQPFWDGLLHLAVAESAEQSPGLIEGALICGERAAAALLSTGLRVPVD